MAACGCGLSGSAPEEGHHLRTGAGQVRAEVGIVDTGGDAGDGSPQNGGFIVCALCKIAEGVGQIGDSLSICFSLLRYAVRKSRISMQ